MSWNPLCLRGISFLSPHKEPAYLEFRKGLNVICGASDTGKSFIVEAIDFLLGSKGPLRDIPERIAYDRARLVCQTSNYEYFTIQRSSSGGNFTLYEEKCLFDESTTEGIPFPPTANPGKDSLSTFLLSKIGLSNKYLQKNLQGETLRLSFRNLARLIIIQEEEITKRNSPILSGQYTLATSEFSLFKLLLTGLDASSINEHPQKTPVVEISQETSNVKAELINELIDELRSELHQFGVDRTTVEARLKELNLRINDFQKVIKQLENESIEKQNKRSALIKDLNNLTDRSDEIISLLSRFSLLKDHYKVDLERLVAIQESGSLFVYLEKKPCPMCGALPDNQHLGETCDGDVESVISAATSEIEKIHKLSSELEQTITDLNIEFGDLDKQKAEFSAEIKVLTTEINKAISPIKEVEGNFLEIVKEIGDQEGFIEKFNRIEKLEKKKTTIAIEPIKPIEVIQIDPSTEISNPRVDISTTVLDQYAQKVQKLLQEWNFPGADRIHFDEVQKDLIIGGQPRTSRGKGLRAITHAAMTIGLMEFCKEKNLSHPGFVVLDSPLLAYYKPESDEDNLAGSDLKDRFYKYLANKNEDSQIIVIENEHPLDELKQNINLTDFTKNPNDGRYGFFPYFE